MSNFPPQGTVCQDCKCCEAAVYAGPGVPVCWECDEGVPCKGRQAAPAPKAMATVERAAAKVETTQAKAGAVAGRKLGKALPKRKGQGKGYPISLELRAKVLQADPHISHRQLGRRVGLSDVAVRKIRLENGIPTPPSTYNPRKAPAPAPPAVEAVEPVAGLPPEVAPLVELPVVVTVDPETLPLLDEVAFWRDEASAVYTAWRPPPPNHYAEVIADLEKTRADLLADLEAIENALPLLRAVEARKTATAHLPEEVHA